MTVDVFLSRAVDTFHTDQLSFGPDAGLYRLLTALLAFIANNR